MSWLDIVVIVIILLSALISVVRGFVKESISLVTWVVASMLAFRYFLAMGELLQPFVESSQIRNIAGFLLLFLMVLVVGAIVNFIMSQLVSRTGLSGTDKALGVVFGGARGVLIVAMIVLLASLTPMPSAPWWQDSALIGIFQQLAEWLKGIVPTNAAENFKF